MSLKGNAARPLPSLDAMVNRAICELFPDQTIPDEQNFRADGSRFKAPDHFVPAAEIYIERKSLNPGERDVIAKISAIAQSQGHPGFRAYGKINIRRLLEALPDPAAANRAFHSYWVNRMGKTVREVEKKFHAFFHETKSPLPTALIISDHDPELGSAETFEFAIGRMMEAQPSATDGYKVDAIMYLRAPRSTLQKYGSHWCKLLLRKDLEEDAYQRLHSTLIIIAKHIESSFTTPGSDASWAGSSFRPLLV